jgi:hypothetical protein
LVQPKWSKNEEDLINFIKLNCKWIVMCLKQPDQFATHKKGLLM